MAASSRVFAAVCRVSWFLLERRMSVACRRPCVVVASSWSGKAREWGGRSEFPSAKVRFRMDH